MTSIQTSLPPKDKKSEQRVVEFFDNYFTKPIQVSANDYDAVVGFFSKRNFDKVAAVVAQVLNFQRNKSSTIGFKISPTFEYGERRNVVV